MEMPDQGREEEYAAVQRVVGLMGTYRGPTVDRIDLPAFLNGSRPIILSFHRNH